MFSGFGSISKMLSARVFRSPRALLLPACGLLLAAYVSSSGGAAPGAPSPPRGGNLTIARSADTVTFDISKIADNESGWPAQLIYDTLYIVGPDGKTLLPRLATRYVLSKDRLSWTFFLRPGVRFSNGQPLTSADVRFSINRTRKSPTWSFLVSSIKRIDTPTPRTVIIRTKFPWAPLLSDVSLYATAVIPENFAGQPEAKFFQRPIGTGSFMVSSWRKGQALKLVRNPNYWEKGKPYLDSVTLTVVTDSNSRALQLRGGTVDVTEFPPWSVIDSLQKTPGLKVTLFPSGLEYQLLFNLRRKLLQDVHVRRAIAFAIDKPAIVKAVLFGHGRPANSFLPPSVTYYDPTLKGLQYDVKRAKAELAMSSVPGGFSFTMNVASGDADQSTMAQIIQEAVKKIGITMRIRQVDANTFFQLLDEGKYDTGINTIFSTDISDPDELVTLGVVFSGGIHSVFTYYNNPRVTKLAAQARRTLAPSVRRRLYAQIQRIVANDAPIVPLAYPPYAWAYSDKVKNFRVYPTGNYHLENTWLTR